MAHTLGGRDAVCILTHDAKFDVPAVIGALATSVGYIGVMGSRTTHAKRLARLAEAGVSDPAQLDRLMSPAGLDIGARTPEETAISICAEIIATHTGQSGAAASATRAARSTDAPRRLPSGEHSCQGLTGIFPTTWNGTDLPQMWGRAGYFVGSP